MLLSAQQIADRHGITRQCVHRWHTNGLLNKDGRRVYLAEPARRGRDGTQWHAADVAAFVRVFGLDRDDALTPKQVARMAGVRLCTVYNWINRGMYVYGKREWLRVLNRGKPQLILRTEAERFLAATADVRFPRQRRSVA